jgi:hypothetical protein
MASINRAELFLELSAAEPILVREASRIVKEEYFDEAVAKMQNTFETDRVTQEIDGGIESSNISRTLRGAGPTENLYSFIGFEYGDKPTQPIRDILSPESPFGPQMKYVRGSQVKNLTFQFKITQPDLQEIYKETPMPWGKGLSWAKRIELGIAGLSHFQPLTDVGRSEGGIQVERVVNRAEFKPRKYLTKVIEAFWSKIPQ